MRQLRVWRDRTMSPYKSLAELRKHWWGMAASTEYSKAERHKIYAGMLGSLLRYLRTRTGMPIEKWARIKETVSFSSYPLHEKGKTICPMDMAIEYLSAMDAEDAHVTAFFRATRVMKRMR